MSKTKKLFLSIAIASGSVLPAVALGVGPASAVSASGSCHGAFLGGTGANYGWLGGDGGTTGYDDGAVGQDPGAIGHYNSVNGGCPLD